MSLKRKPPLGDVRRVRSMGLNLPGVTTNKNGHTVQFESFAERILLVLFERDKTVLDYRSQPETFEFTDQDKKIRRYTPDFKVWRADGTIEIHEVTRTERQEQLRISEREAGARKICQERQWKYIVHTEQTLPQETEATNLLALLRYRLKAYAHVIRFSLLYKSAFSKMPLCNCRVVQIILLTTWLWPNRWSLRHSAIYSGMERSAPISKSCLSLIVHLRPMQQSGYPRRKSNNGS